MQSNKPKIITKGNRKELIIKPDATQKEYETFLNKFFTLFKIQDVKEVNDFDSYYHLFKYNDYALVLSYSNFYGISIYFDNDNFKSEIQEAILKEFLAEISKNNL